MVIFWGFCCFMFLAGIILPQLPVETEQMGVFIVLAGYCIADNPGGNGAEGDTVAAVAQGKKGVWPFGYGAYVGQAVFGNGKSAAPAKIGL